jgi:2-polyprenyl-3-methyl-5-hydroxy-6-metoxy-1,4-benzoquinol methylase
VKQYQYFIRETCPVCYSTQSVERIIVPDYRLTKHEFPIHECLSCGLHYTKIVPDENEIGDFYKSDTYDSHRLDNGSLISRIYRLVRFVNIRKKVSWIRRYCNQGLVVDYGCGLGHFVQALKENGFNSLGYEIDADVRELTKSELNITTYPPDDFLALARETVDVLTMWHVLEHVYHLNADFSEIISRLKIGGHIFIAVPNYKSWDAKYYGRYWEAYDVPRHLYHFDKKTLVRFAARFGLRHLETIPMKYDAYYVSMRSEKNKPKGSIIRGVWNGLVSNCKGKTWGFSSHVFVFKKF